MMSNNALVTLLVTCTTLLALSHPAESSTRLQSVPQELQGIWSRRTQYFDNKYQRNYTNDDHTFFNHSLSDGKLMNDTRLRNGKLENVYVYTHNKSGTHLEVRIMVEDQLLWILDLDPAKFVGYQHGDFLLKQGALEARPEIGSPCDVFPYTDNDLWEDDDDRLDLKWLRLNDERYGAAWWSCAFVVHSYNQNTDEAVLFARMKHGPDPNHRSMLIPIYLKGQMPQCCQKMIDAVNGNTPK